VRRAAGRDRSPASGARRRAIGFAVALALIAGPGACASSGASAFPRGPLALRLRRTDGATLNLGALRGQVVLLHLMATWAGPALLEVPTHLRLHRELGPRGLALVAVALDDRPESVPIFAETFEVPYAVTTPFDAATLTGPAGPFGRIVTLPTSVLVDRSGHVVARQEGVWDPAELRARIEALLAEDPSGR
jgi:cytochrome c biogenesis protein CcmG/thiol:disulfide interchange protein DsbE